MCKVASLLKAFVIVASACAFVANSASAARKCPSEYELMRTKSKAAKAILKEPLVKSAVKKVKYLTKKCDSKVKNYCPNKLSSVDNTLARLKSVMRSRDLLTGLIDNFFENDFATSSICPPTMRVLCGRVVMYRNKKKNLEQDCAEWDKQYCGEGLTTATAELKRVGGDRYDVALAEHKRSQDIYEACLLNGIGAQ